MRHHRAKITITVLLVWGLLGHIPSSVRAESSIPAKVTLPLAELDPDPAIPTIKESLGYDWATRITSHAGLEQYLRDLAGAAPDRAKLVRYGDSYEGRGLYYLVITSVKNLQQLEKIRRANLQLSDPRRTTRVAAASMIDPMPAVVWLAASIHGNELSSTEAALLTGYHLLADQRPQTRELLERLVVLIDPLQNPDGRERFMSVYQETRGTFPDAHPLSTEHAERWPGGRFNHYYFDMNRDWFLQSQQETRHRVRAYLQWQPQIFVDAHEMGQDRTYFFAPSANPVNPFVLPTQHRWLYQLGQHQAGWFDRHGFAYTTREIFDAFFPGYGSQWPTFQGGLGILWEQAGTRGLMVNRDDETTLHYRDAISHHYISSMATLEIAAQRRAELLRDFHDARVRGVELGEQGPVRHFLLPLEPQPQQATRLAQLLQRNGIDVGYLTQDLRVSATDIHTGEKSHRIVPQGTLHVPVAQPAGRLARALLDRHVEMDADYVQEQMRRKEEYLPDQIYDVTAWSLPLAFDLPCLATGDAIDAHEPWKGPTKPSADQLPEAQVAYLVRFTDGAPEALCQWLQQGIRVHVTSKALALDQREFAPGTLVVKRRENPAHVHQIVARAMEKYQLDVTAANTGFVSEGAHFGGPHVHWVRPPKIVLAMDRPTRYTVGHTWHLFDQRLRYPTTRVSCENLPRLKWHDFNVLILPDGDYEQSPLNADFAARLKQWVSDGGTLILFSGAVAWAASEKIDLITLPRVAKPASQPIEKGGPADVRASDSSRHDDPRWPDRVPGAFMKAETFPDHWLAFGSHPTMHVFVTGNMFFAPPDPEKGRSVVRFAAAEGILASGFCFPETKQLLAGTTYLAHFAQGEGHVIAFAGDPNYRAMYPGLQRLFINACLFGPGQ